MAGNGDSEMKKTVLIVLGDGFEEIEAVTPMDVLRRAGLEVVVAGMGKREITGAHGIKVLADVLLTDFKEIPDAVVVPGGPGAKELGKSAVLKTLLNKVNASGKVVAGICAAPALVLSPSGILDGKKATCYPGYEGQLGPKTTFVAERVVTDGQVITSRGPGSALEFSLELVKKLIGTQAAAELSEAMVAKA